MLSLSALTYTSCHHQIRHTNPQRWPASPHDRHSNVFLWPTEQAAATWGPPRWRPNVTSLPRVPCASAELASLAHGPAVLVHPTLLTLCLGHAELPYLS